MKRAMCRCLNCGDPGHNSRTCPLPLEAELTDRRERWRLAKIAEGFCGWCGKRKLATGTRCRACSKRKYDARRVSRLIARGAIA